MTRKTIYVRGNCPHLDHAHSIEATYAKYNVLGDPTSYSKCVSVYCEYSNECDQASSCPLVHMAQSRTRW